MRKMTILAALGSAIPALAWGPEGHNLVARIAEAQLTATARARIIEILGPGVSLASISNWADQVRPNRPETAPWHYVDIPIDKPHLDLARDCPGGNCILTRIGEFRAQVAVPGTNPAARR